MSFYKWFLEVIQVEMAPRQGPRHLKFDAEVGLASGLKSGSIREIKIERDRCTSFVMFSGVT